MAKNLKMFNRKKVQVDTHTHKLLREFFLQGLQQKHYERFKWRTVVVMLPRKELLVLPGCRAPAVQVAAVPRPRSSSCCAGAGGPRGATPRSRSGRTAVRRHPLFKIRSSSCAFLEQP